MQRYRQQAQIILAEFDFLLTPTVGTIYTIDEVEADPIKLNSNLGYYTNYMNLLDCACVAVPSGFLDNGLPLGISLVSTSMQDQKLLSYANRWQQHNNINPGNLDLPLAATQAGSVVFSELVSLIVCGAHLDGLALNWQLRERGARLQEKLTTAKSYRMFVIKGSIQRPGLIRDEQNGREIDVEIWQLPKHELGGFVADIAAPLGIGKVETNDGRWLPGFICEAYALEAATEITDLGGWRQYLEAVSVE